MQMTFIAENIAIILNIVLIFTFYYQIRKTKQRIALSNSSLPPHSPNNNKNFNRSSSVSSRNHNKNSNQLNYETIYVTWSLLIIGFIFSLCQGLIENWLTNDCGAAWLQWMTFFFYCAHRALLLFSFLHRLMFVFKDSAYAYPNWFYYILMFLIISYFISSYIIYGVDYGITYVPINMYTGYSGEILCSWSFGVLMPGIARPMELTLTLILVIAFLYKLWRLHRLLTIVNSGEGKKINKLLVVFRKVTLLTLCAITTTVIVTFGYINFKPFAFALSLDAVFNSFCVFLMFQFNQTFIQPCFGYKCDRLCCIKFEGVWKCKIICGNCCKNKYTQNPQTQIKSESFGAVSNSNVTVGIGSPKSNLSQKSNPCSDFELHVTSSCEKSTKQNSEQSTTCSNDSEIP
eukprot:55883_1